jgi:CubicO group peptidase (beta-lactamase class C family)
MEKIGANWHLFHWDEDYPQRSDQDGPRMELDSSASELAKLGYLWLRQGNWKTGRIFSEEFYREAMTDWSPNTGDPRPKHLGHYGYWWFLNSGRVKLPNAPEDAFYAYGNGEHRRATLLLVIPSLDTVAVLSMERLSDDGKWDVIKNAQTQTVDGPRAWSSQIVALYGEK